MSDTALQTMRVEHIQAQNQASDPLQSVWVAANAGSGKTHVLINRMIRLMLPPVNTPPEKILCITFTKNAAAQMAQKLYERLGSWVALSDDALQAILQDMMNQTQPLSESFLRQARRLFARTLETPGGLKIQTIHGFCEQILQRFPLEIGLTPNFTILDDNSQSELFRDCLKIVMQNALETAGPLRAAANYLGQIANDKTLTTLLADLQRPFHLWSWGYDGDWQDALDKSFPKGEEPSDCWERLLTNLDTTELQHCARLACEDSLVSNQKIGKHLIDFLQASDRQQQKQYLEAIFLTSKGEARQRLLSGKLAKACPEKNALLFDIQQHILTCQQQEKRWQIYKQSHAVFTLAEAVYKVYEQKKQDVSMLDYDDLIQKAALLLHDRNLCDWVLYKLDGGIDHILLDEAQDTSQEQWAIIRALSADFFSGQSARNIQRTVFSVGDRKQSIYSFQNASPESLLHNSDYFQQQTHSVGAGWQEVSLLGSFRSAPAIIKFVDAVFADKQLCQSVNYSQQAVQHHAIQNPGPGYVELWQPFQSMKQEELIWDMPLDSVQQGSALSRIAHFTAMRIQQVLQSAIVLPSTGKAVKPGDILVLLQKRGGLMRPLARQLKALGLPVSGLDRLNLLQEMAVLDCLALIDFVLLPEDDLTLASLLKSPLCNISEERLGILAYHRDGSLWSELQKQDDLQHITDMLKDCLKQAGMLLPYDFLVYVLETHQGRRYFQARLGYEVVDSLNELLNQALNYGRQNTPSLQGFVYWLRGLSVELKREMDNGRGEIRLMTIHGAKGLEAPIVFIPQCCPVPDAGKLPSWVHDQDQLLWLGHHKNMADIRDICDKQKQQQHDEYIRLLYVALTRARDRLYIGGALDGRSDKISQKSWYHFITQGMESLPATTTTFSYGQEQVVATVFQDNDIMQSSDKNEVVKPLEDKLPLPDWAYKTISTAHIQQKITTASTAFARSEHARTGILLHRLLELDSEDEHILRQIAAQEYPDLSESEQYDACALIIKLRQNSEYSWIFAQSGMNEVPIAGRIEFEGAHVQMNGQIDRLLISEQEIIIIDYKSDQTIPKGDKIPGRYRRQMIAYAKLLAKLYPEHQIKAAILWLRMPKLSWIECFDNFVD